MVSVKNGYLLLSHIGTKLLRKESRVLQWNLSNPHPALLIRTNLIHIPYSVRFHGIPFTYYTHFTSFYTNIIGQKQTHAKLVIPSRFNLMQKVMKIRLSSCKLNGNYTKEKQRAYHQLREDIALSERLI